MNRTGIDIISRRFGILEKKVLKEILNLNKDAKIYDLGSGKSFFSVAIAFMKNKIFAIDKNFQKFTFWKLFLIKKLFNLKNLKIEKKDISKMNYKNFQNDISIIYSALFFHYLKYSDGKKLLKILSKKLKKDGKIFFSISGINSDIAKNYKGKNFLLEERFFKISSNIQNRFEIKEKVCLYSKNEIKEIFSQFFTIEKIWESDFKNIFVVAKKK